MAMWNNQRVQETSRKPRVFTIPTFIQRSATHDPWKLRLKPQALWMGLAWADFPSLQAMKHRQEYNWLVVYLPLSKILVNGKDDIPYIMENKSHVPNHQPDN